MPKDEKSALGKAWEAIDRETERARKIQKQTAGMIHEIENSGPLSLTQIQAIKDKWRKRGHPEDMSERERQMEIERQVAEDQIAAKTAENLRRNLHESEAVVTITLHPGLIGGTDPHEIQITRAGCRGG